MLQWMGGARKRINVSKNSLQRRQKQFFEQRRQDRQSQAVNGTACVASHQQDEACVSNVIKSLDIQCLQRLCEDEDAALGADKETPAPPSRRKKLSVQATLPYARTTPRETGTFEADRNRTLSPPASALYRDTLDVSREAKNGAQAPRVPQTKCEVRRKDEAAPRISETNYSWENQYRNFNLGHACEDSDARLKPPVPTLLQKVGSWLDLPERGASTQLYGKEAQGVCDAACQEMDARSWDGDLELDWASCRLDPQQPTFFELDAEQVTFPDILMLEPGSLGLPCFGGSSSASSFVHSSSFFPEEKTLDPSFLTFGHKPKHTFSDIDLDLQPRSDDSDCHMFLETRSFKSPGSTFQQAPELGSKSKHGIKNPPPWTFDPEATDAWDSYRFQSPDQNSQEESVFRHHSHYRPWEASSGENLRENLKRKMVHDASSSSKGTYCISPVAMSPVSHLAPSPQKSCKRRKQTFWDDQSGCWTFLPSAEDAEFNPCRGKHSRLTSMSSSKNLDKQVVGYQQQERTQGETVRVAACSSGSLQSVLHEPPEPGHVCSAGIFSNQGGTPPPAQSVVEKSKSRVNRKAGSYRSLELSSRHDPGPPAVKQPLLQEGLCAAPDGNSNIQLLSSFPLDVHRQQEDKMQQEDTAAGDVQTAREVDVVPLSRRGDPSRDIRSFQLHYSQSNVRPSYSRNAGSKVESPKTVPVSPLPRAAVKCSIFSSLQSPSGQKSNSSNCNSRAEGLQRLQDSPPNSDRECEDGNRRLNSVISSDFVADSGHAERSGVCHTSKTLNQLKVVEDASEKVSSHQEKEGEPIIIRTVVEEDQTAQDPIRTVASEVPKENVTTEKRGLLLESKNEVQMETPHRKRLSNNSVSQYPTHNECGQACARHTKTDERMRNPFSSSVLEDREYVGMLESYVVQLKLVNRILQETAEQVDERVEE